MEDDDKFSLRDKLAIEMLKIAFSSDSHNEKFREYFYAYDDDVKYKNQISESLEKKMHRAYELADLMRKVRLGVFK